MDRMHSVVPFGMRQLVSFLANVFLKRSVKVMIDYLLSSDLQSVCPTLLKATVVILFFN